MKRLVCLLGLAAAMLALPACGGGDAAPSRANVTGQVLLDGQPMPDGEVSFVQSGVPSAVLEVKNGSFSGQAYQGKSTVEVRAYKAGKAVEMGGEKYGGEKENYIPAKYNSESKMTADVPAGGRTDLKFEVTSK